MARRDDDPRTIDSILAALYDSISGPAGPRDWDRLRALFRAPGLLGRTVLESEGGERAALDAMTIEGFIASAAPHFAMQGFFEREVARQVAQFGHVASVLSVYEARHDGADLAPFARGVNSVQLFYDGARWWIIALLWDDERPGCAIPAALFEP